MRLSVCLLLVFAFVSVAGAQQTPDDEVVRVNSDLVTLNITVTNARGEYAHGLKREDFKIYEDGRAQTIASFGVEETPFVAAILLDTSGSMDGRLMLARSAAIRFLDGLRADDLAAVYRFDNDIEQVQEFSPSRDLPQVAYNFSAKGLTVLNDAVIRAAQDLAARPEKRRAIIILSDGADTHSRASQDKALDAALRCGATIYSVNLVPPDAPAQERMMMTNALRAFAEKSGGRYIAFSGGQGLRDAFASIVEELSNQYTISYQPTNRARDGRWRAIEVKMNRSDLTARTRRGYRAPKS
jgi:Ca-activated chloride channel family protein